MFSRIGRSLADYCFFFSLWLSFCPFSGLLKHLRKEEGADAFLSILIFVVLKSNPENLLSNVEQVSFRREILVCFRWLTFSPRFISRFRNPAKLQSEAGYYLSSLVRIFYPVEVNINQTLTDGGHIIYRDDGSYSSLKHHAGRVCEER